MILSCWFLQQSDLFLIIRDHNLIQFSIIIKLILFSSKTNHDISFMLNDRFHVGCINQEKTAHPGENPDGKNPKQSRGYVTGQTVKSTILQIEQSLKMSSNRISQTFIINDLCQKQNNFRTTLKSAYILPRGHTFLQAVFNDKSLELSKAVYTIRFLRLWKIFLVRVQKNFRNFE